MVAHTHPFVIGVDAHARNHALAILACPTGEVLDEGQFPATGAGLQRAVDWVARRTGGDLDTLWVVEAYLRDYLIRVRSLACSLCEAASGRTRPRSAG